MHFSIAVSHTMKPSDKERLVKCRPILIRSLDVVTILPDLRKNAVFSSEEEDVITSDARRRHQTIKVRWRDAEQLIVNLLTLERIFLNIIITFRRSASTDLDQALVVALTQILIPTHIVSMNKPPMCDQGL